MRLPLISPLPIAARSQTPVVGFAGHKSDDTAKMPKLTFSGTDSTSFSGTNKKANDIHDAQRGHTHLHHAALTGDLAEATELAGQPDANLEKGDNSDYHFTPLSLSGLAGHLPVAQMLRGKGAKIQAWPGNIYVSDLVKGQKDRLPAHDSRHSRLQSVIDFFKKEEEEPRAFTGYYDEWDKK